MKKSSYLAALLLIGVGLAGCPVYDGNDVGCFDDYDCPYGYVCDGYDGVCVTASGNSNTCKAPGDCGTNETCSRSGTCMDGDCHFASVGCVDGYECSSASGRWECVAEGAGGTSGGASNGGAPMSSAGEPSTSNGGTGEPGTTTNGGAGESGAAGEPTSSGGAGG